MDNNVLSDKIKYFLQDWIDVRNKKIFASFDFNDFWLFANKFDKMQEKVSSVSRKKLFIDNSEGQRDPKFVKLFQRFHLFYEQVNRLSLPFSSTSINTFYKTVLNLYIDFSYKNAVKKLEVLSESAKNLPIYQYKDEIVDKLKQGVRVLVVAGDTGCGKSTQVPQYLLSTGYTKIICTQPRRIACIGLCNRVCKELGEEPFGQVGYKIRFESEYSSVNNDLLFVTEGILLRTLCSDSLLNCADIILMDEVHERHITTDFLLGSLKCLLRHRKELKIILMSATINLDLFTAYFREFSCHLIQVPGRLYPIDVVYASAPSPVSQKKCGKFTSDKYLFILQSIDSKYSADDLGDVLVFLPGMTEIQKVYSKLNDYAKYCQKWIILILHSSISLSEQDKVFNYPPEGVRKCILSTNIAETSVTIDGVRFVIDSGQVKEMRYDPKCKMQRLQLFWVSKASAEQRKGRAGRTGPGICYRMYHSKQYEEFVDYTSSEILNMPLHSLILQMLSLGLTDPKNFPFIQPPPTESIDDSIKYLLGINAIQNNTCEGSEGEELHITTLGLALNNFPVDVSLAKMLLISKLIGYERLLLSLVALLSVQSIFTNWGQRSVDAIDARSSLVSREYGDPVTLLNILNAWIKLKIEGKVNAYKWCKRIGVEEQRMFEVLKLRNQFHKMLHSLSAEEGKDENNDSYMRSKRRGRFVSKKKKDCILKNRSTSRESIDSVSESDNEEFKSYEIDFENYENRKYLKAIHIEQLSAKDCIAVNFVLCASLYPQIAIVDEFNDFSGDNDLIFHTNKKLFVLLHPHSSLAPPDSTFSKPSIPSYFNTLLGFVSLLETTKPYLIQVFRFTALPFLLFFASNISTNFAASRIICDNWLEFTLTTRTIQHNFVAKVVSLRLQWQTLLESYCTNFNLNSIASELKKFLSVLFNDVLTLNTIEYSIKRVSLTSTSLKMLEMDNALKKNFELFAKDYVIQKFSCQQNSKKRGIEFFLTPYFAYGTLAYNSDDSISTFSEGDIQYEYICSKCQGLLFHLYQILVHELICQSNEPSLKENSEEKEELSYGNQGKFHLECEYCKKSFNFVSIKDVLTHKKHCNKNHSI